MVWINLAVLMTGGASGATDGAGEAVSGIFAPWPESPTDAGTACALKAGAVSTPWAIAAVVWSAGLNCT